MKYCKKMIDFYPSYENQKSTRWEDISQIKSKQFKEKEMKKVEFFHFFSQLLLLSASHILLLNNVSFMFSKNYESS